MSNEKRIERIESKIDEIYNEEVISLWKRIHKLENKNEALEKKVQELEDFNTPAEYKLELLRNQIDRVDKKVQELETKTASDLSRSTLSKKETVEESTGSPEIPEYQYGLSVARDRDGSLWLYDSVEPYVNKKSGNFTNEIEDQMFHINDSLFPEVTFENSPQKLVLESAISKTETSQEKENSGKPDLQDNYPSHWPRKADGSGVQVFDPIEFKLGTGYQEWHTGKVLFIGKFHAIRIDSKETKHLVNQIVHFDKEMWNKGVQFRFPEEQDLSEERDDDIKHWPFVPAQNDLIEIKTPNHDWAVGSVWMITGCWIDLNMSNGDRLKIAFDIVNMTRKGYDFRKHKGDNWIHYNKQNALNLLNKLELFFAHGRRAGKITAMKNLVEIRKVLGGE